MYLILEIVQNCEVLVSHSSRATGRSFSSDRRYQLRGTPQAELAKSGAGSTTMRAVGGDHSKGVVLRLFLDLHLLLNRALLVEQGRPTGARFPGAETHRSVPQSTTESLNDHRLQGGGFMIRDELRTEVLRTSRPESTTLPKRFQGSDSNSQTTTIQGQALPAIADTQQFLKVSPDGEGFRPIVATINTAFDFCR